MSNRLDVYVGGRTLWLTSTLDPKRLSEQSASATRTAPIIGGRVNIDINPVWFVLADGNLGGIGADDVSFTGSLQGMVGYRFHMGAVPASVELGYRALRITTEPVGMTEEVGIAPVGMIRKRRHFKAVGFRPKVSAFMFRGGAGPAMIVILNTRAENDSLSTGRGLAVRRPPHPGEASP